MSDASVDWELASRIARRVAGTEPLASSYLYDSLEPDFAEATVLAEQLVSAETGLASLDGPARARVIDRGDWIDANIRSFQRLLRPLTDKVTESLDGPFSAVSGRVAAVQHRAADSARPQRPSGNNSVAKPVELLFFWPEQSRFA